MLRQSQPRRLPSNQDRVDDVRRGQRQPQHSGRPAKETEEV
jgi:hypothetical protein